MYEHLNDLKDKAHEWKVIWSNHVTSSLSLNPYYQQLIGIRDMFMLMDFVGVNDYIEYTNDLLLQINELYYSKN